MILIDFYVSVARGAWFSEVCSGRKTQETAVSKLIRIDKTAAIAACPRPKTKMQNEEHLCLIAVIGVERPNKATVEWELEERDGVKTRAHGL